MRLRTLAILLIGLDLIVAWCFAEVVLVSRHTLQANGRWISTKSILGRHVPGSYHYLATRKALHRNRLDLSTWHGWNEVTYREPVERGAIEFDFLLENEAYLTVSFDRQDAGARAFRLSRNALFPWAAFLVAHDGTTQPMQPVDDAGLEPGWHRARIEATATDDRLLVDDRCLATLPPAGPRTGFVSFRSGSQRALLDNVVMRDPAGRETLQEDFRKRHGWWAQLALACGALLVFQAIWFFAARRRRNSERLHGALAFVVTLGACCALYLAFDALYYSGLYPPQPAGTDPQPSKPLQAVLASRHALLRGFEHARTRLLASSQLSAADSIAMADARSAAGRMLLAATSGTHDDGRETLLFGRRFNNGIEGHTRFDTLRVPRTSRTVRVALLGGSQAWGAGAETARRTWAAQLAARLETVAAGTDFDVEVFALGISGFTVRQLESQYREYWLACDPDLALVDAGYNDQDSIAFRDGLQDLVDLLQSRQVRVVLAAEAYSSEISRSVVDANHRIARDLAGERGLPFLELHDWVNSSDVRDCGALWWDAVHWTGLGQQLVGEWTAAQLLELDAIPALSRNSIPATLRITTR